MYDLYFSYDSDFENDQSNEEEIEDNLSSGTVEFASSTDVTMYTVQPINQPVDVAEQSTVYLLEIRNLLLILIFIVVIFKLYGMLKNTIINFYER